MRIPERHKAVAVILISAMVVGLTLIPRPTRTVQGCNIYSRTDEGAFYLDPSYKTRFRIKGDQVAIRLEGAFDTSESAYKELKPGEGVYFKAIRKVASSSSKTAPAERTVMEVVAANIKGEIKWTLGYIGDANNSQDRALLASNVGSRESFDCQILPKKQTEALNLKELKFPGVTFAPDQIVAIPDSSLVYSKLGL